MTTITETESRPWDLTQLLQFLPPAATQATHPELAYEDNGKTVSPALTDRNDNHETPAASLGDLSAVWHFLGVPIDSTRGLGAIPRKVDYASDGAIYHPSAPDRPESTTVPSPELNDAGDAPASGHTKSIAHSESPASARQQKKDRKRWAKRQEGRTVAAVSESECDSGLRRERTPARKASSHAMANRTMVTRSMSAKMHAESPAYEQAVNAVAEAARHMEASGSLDTPCPRTRKAAKSRASAQAIAHTNGSITQDRSPEAAHTIAPRHALPTTEVTVPQQSLWAWKTNNLLPSSILPQNGTAINAGPRSANTSIPSSVQRSQNGETDINVQPIGPRSMDRAPPTPMIEPITLRSGEERELALYLKIISNFGADRKHLVKPMNMTTHNNNPSGIHVFIDASNIFIGFLDQLKRSRRIPQYQRVPDVHPSFDSLALLLERRRPVAKRVLVGSTPYVPAFDKAKAVGYETSILTKVRKCRELTERQIYFMQQEEESRRSGRKSSARVPPPPHKIGLPGSVLATGRWYGSGSETNTPIFDKEKDVEQGVDEVLHCKMMESVLDAETPGTMVLATGDAACAEYSSGFGAMVERALKKGWTVELCSWSKNISGIYRRAEWAHYGGRLKIIELDDYAEDLLDM